MSADSTEATDADESSEIDPGAVIGTNMMRRQGSSSIVLTMPQHVRSKKNVALGDIWAFHEGPSDDPDTMVLKRTGAKADEFRGFDHGDEEDENGDE